MPGQNPGKTPLPASSHSEKVKKSRQSLGLVNIMFSRHLRDSLRVIAGVDGKTLIALLDEISEDYIANWQTKWRLNNKGVPPPLSASPPKKTQARPTPRPPASSAASNAKSRARL